MQKHRHAPELDVLLGVLALEMLHEVRLHHKQTNESSSDRQTKGQDKYQSDWELQDVPQRNVLVDLNRPDVARANAALHVALQPEIVGQRGLDPIEEQKRASRD
jgi:hypothetical protein